MRRGEGIAEPTRLASSPMVTLTCLLGTFSVPGPVLNEGIPELTKTWSLALEELRI